MIVLAVGKPGTGKSTLLHDLVAAQCHEQRFLVKDNEAGWGADGVHWRGHPPPLRIFYKGRSALPKLEEWPEVGVFVFRGFEGREVAELAKQLGDSCYVDDEIDKAGKKEGFDKSALRDIVNEGRHLENARGEYTQVHIYGACRRVAKLHTDLSELADEVYVFRSDGLRTLSRLLDDGHILEEQVDQVKALPDFQCLHYPSRQLKVLRPVGSPRSVYVRPVEQLDEDA